VGRVIGEGPPVEGREQGWLVRLKEMGRLVTWREYPLERGSDESCD